MPAVMPCTDQQLGIILLLLKLLQKVRTQSAGARARGGSRSSRGIRHRPATPEDTAYTEGEEQAHWAAGAAQQPPPTSARAPAGGAAGAAGQPAAEPPHAAGSTMPLDSYADGASAAAGLGCRQHQLPPRSLLLPALSPALQQHPHQPDLAAAPAAGPGGSSTSERQLRGALQQQVALQQMLFQTMKVRVSVALLPHLKGSSKRLSGQPCNIIRYFS